MVRVTVGIGNLIDSPAATWQTRLYDAPFAQKDDMVTESTEDQVLRDSTEAKGNPALKGKWPTASSAR